MNSRQALLVQAEADLNRQLALQQRQVASEARLDESRSKRDATVAALEQAKGQVQQAKINLGYTEIKAPFAGRGDGAAGRPRIPGRRRRADQTRHHRANRSHLRQFQCQRAAGLCRSATSCEARA